jgi:hypothetical protein
MGLILPQPAPQHEPTRSRLDGLRVATEGHQVLRIPGEYRLDGRRGVVGETVLQRGHRQAGVVRVVRLKRTPAGDVHLQRYVRVAQRDRAKREAHSETGLAETRQPERGARSAVAGAGLLSAAAAGPAMADGKATPTAAAAHVLRTSRRDRSDEWSLFMGCLLRRHVAATKQASGGRLPPDDVAESDRGVIRGLTPPLAKADGSRDCPALESQAYEDARTGRASHAKTLLRLPGELQLAFRIAGDWEY